ncbi:cobyrinic acid a,c-diamide synthase [Natronosalvus vescus]|uniref:cobyrinic acid a,c-diamide synthase n=1 Tax=Natronosalvus vescus TaxID=2953881 RepID=UPI0020919096|nr:cobyrinic acid a,c-diamide synthase [Natronosalvus vescus]
MNDSSAVPAGFVVGGVSSGVGKTVATLAIGCALEDAGYAVQPAKAGPDFIDPSHHESITGRPSRTLDRWLCGEDGLRRNYARGEGEICVVEGLMGLYDGDRSSTAMVAEALDLPVVLVVDANAGMESVAATALGFAAYAERIDRNVEVAGIVAQRAHGGRHEHGIREALPDDLAYFGRVPPSEELEIPDRHLGLEMGSETQISRDALDEAAETIDAERLASIARVPPGLESASAASGGGEDETGELTVAFADDAAFCFRYPATIERLRERATVRTFSPVAGDPVPDCDGVYLPGGYPELHGERLEGGGTLEHLGRLASDGLPVFGECGGLMAMSESLTTVDGERYDMAGILPATVTMCDRYQALDHVELEALERTLTARSGEEIRGHEFHYSRADVGTDARFRFETVRGRGITGERDGLAEYAALGTYAHVHPESGAFDRFLDSLES